MKFEVKKDGTVFLNGAEVSGYKSYSVDFNSIDGPEVVIRFAVDEVNIDHLQSCFTEMELQI